MGFRRQLSDINKSKICRNIPILENVAAAVKKDTNRIGSILAASNVKEY